MYFIEYFIVVGTTSNNYQSCWTCWWRFVLVYTKLFIKKNQQFHADEIEILCFDETTHSIRKYKKKSWSTIVHVNGQLLQPFAAAAAAKHPFNCINLYSDALPDRWNLQTNNNNRSKRWCTFLPMYSLLPRSSAVKWISLKCIPAVEKSASYSTHTSPSIYCKYDGSKAVAAAAASAPPQNASEMHSSQLAK